MRRQGAIRRQDATCTTKVGCLAINSPSNNNKSELFKLGPEFDIVATYCASRVVRKVLFQNVWVAVKAARLSGGSGTFADEKSAGHADFGGARLAKELDLSASEKVSYRAIDSAIARQQGHL